MDNREELKKLYKSVFGVEINDENKDLSFKKIGVNSLQVVELLVAIQENMGYDLYDSDVDLMKLRTFSQVLDAINNL